MKYIIAIVCAIAAMPSFLIAQPVIDTAKPGKEVVGSYLLRLKPLPGEVFRYKVSIRSQVSAKNSDELLSIPDLKPNDMSTYSIIYYITATVRQFRDDGASDFQVRIDSIHSSLDDNGSLQTFTTSKVEDRGNPPFDDKALYAGNDFGVIIDTLGNFKEVYGYYNIVDQLTARFEDSLQTRERVDSIWDDVLANSQKILHHLFCYLPKDQVVKGDSSTSSSNEDYAVWSTLTFPMQKDYKEMVSGTEIRDGRVYVIFHSESSMVPIERTLDEPEYHTTLPTYEYSNKDIYYVDRTTGMLAFDKWNEEQSYGMKIESKLPEKSGKSFVTVQRSKVETIVELLR